MEEEKTLEAKAEAAEPEPEPVSEEEAEPTPEPPGAEVLPEALEVETKTVQELAERVKTCLIERNSCENVGSKFDDAAKELDIPVGDLVNRVFRLVSG